MSTDVTKIQKLNSPKPDMKTPKDQQVKKKGEHVPLTKAVVPPFVFYGIPIKCSVHKYSKLWRCDYSQTK